MNPLAQRGRFARWLFECADGRWVIGQAPNIPLYVAAGLSVLSWIPMGVFHPWVARAAGVAWAYWAALELFTGVNRFRRILGGVVLLFAIVRIVTG